MFAIGTVCMRVCVGVGTVVQCVSVCVQDNVRRQQLLDEADQLQQINDNHIPRIKHISVC